MRIIIGTDTRGEALRTRVADLLKRRGINVVEVQTDEAGHFEYPEIAADAARQILLGHADRAVLMGRTGMSKCVVANKFPGIRAAVCHDELSAEMSRRYLDLNVLCLSADLISPAMVERILETWLDTPFDGGRHAERIERIAALEREACSYLQEPVGERAAR